MHKYLLLFALPLLSLMSATSPVSAAPERVNVFTGGQDGVPAVRIPSIVVT